MTLQPLLSGIFFSFLLVWSFPLITICRRCWNNNFFTVAPCTESDSFLHVTTLCWCFHLCWESWTLCVRKDFPLFYHGSIHARKAIPFYMYVTTLCWCFFTFVESPELCVCGEFFQQPDETLLINVGRGLHKKYRLKRTVAWDGLLTSPPNNDFFRFWTDNGCYL